MALARLAVNAIISFSSIPLHLITILGILFFVIAILMSGYTFLIWLSGKALSGFATIILLQLGIASLIMVGLGIVGEYLSAIYQEVKKRPLYFIMENCEDNMEIISSDINSEISREK